MSQLDLLIQAPKKVYVEVGAVQLVQTFHNKLKENVVELFHTAVNKIH